MAPADSPPKNLAPIEPAVEAHVTGDSEVNEPARWRYGAFWFALRLNALIWLGDAIWLVRDRPPYPKPAAQGLFAALFLGTIVFAIFGLALQIAVGFAKIGRSQPIFPRVRAWLFDGTTRDHAERIALLIAVPLVLAVYMIATFFVSYRVILGMARPEFAGLALVGAQLVLLMAAGLILPSARGFGLVCGVLLVRLPILRRAWQVALLLLGLGAVALGIFVFRYHEPLGYLPWRSILQLSLAFVAAVALAYRPRRAPKLTAAAVWPFRLVALGCVAAGAVAAFSLTTNTGYARRVAERDSLSGGIAYTAVRAVLDRDHDGYISILGDGDCAPKDASRNPGAADIPGNGIDEDCDGFDLDPTKLAERGKRDFAVADTVPKRPPTILLTIDAFAADRMKRLGGKRGITPNLDRLAERSAFFTSCYSQGPSTRLSFPSMFTSRWDSEIKQQLVGKHPFPIEPSETMLADILNSAGYETIAVLGDSYFSERRWRGITRGFTRVVNSAIEGARPTHNGSKVTDAVLAELKAPHKRPVFLWAHYYDAHSPHVQPADIPEFGKERSDVYDAELMLVDREVGRVIDAIDEIYKGEALIIVTADHGIAFDPPRHEKFNYGYDLSSAVLHVPLLFHSAFIPPREISGVVSTLDIVPTLLNLFRIPALSQIEGTSLVPELLRGEQKRPPELMHQMFLEERLWKREEPLERVALRTDRFNLLQDRKTGFFELYDYRKDPFETHDLSLDPGYEATLRQLKRELALLVYVSRRPETDAKLTEHASDKAEP